MNAHNESGAVFVVYHPERGFLQQGSAWMRTLSDARLFETRNEAASAMEIQARRLGRDDGELLCVLPVWLVVRR